ncbi:hypothetical protein FHR70_003496 [Microvirga lupini]|uniref:DUF3617 family protein n=1 Tax=Microvirga lupini TaxID=420324 RepID=A0A7W4VP78_9HYPH|nr:hypothetical protein [Microvirga lupini]
MKSFTAPRVAAALWVLLIPGHSYAGGDFPVASCKSWNGTVVERLGIDTSAATMRGIITKADLEEYCERDPGGETKQYGGKLTTGQCVSRYQKTERNIVLAAQADCRAGTIQFRYGSQAPRKVRFPLGEEADTSCASGLPPLIEQFKMLCPTAARRMGVE